MLLSFLDLVNCKPLVPSERLLSPGVSVRKQSNRKNSSVNVKGRNTTNTYTRRSFYSGFGVWGRSRSGEFLVVAPVKEMANPIGHIMIDEEATRATEGPLRCTGSGVTGYTSAKRGIDVQFTGARSYRGDREIAERLSVESTNTRIC